MIKGTSIYSSKLSINNSYEIAIVIPTYNESENIGKLIVEINRVSEGRNYCIVVVDDNSPDKTADVVLSLMDRLPNLYLISRPRKLGLGAAYFEAFEYSRNTLNARYAVQMDADFSHDPNDLPSIIEALYHGADMVIGSRKVKGGALIGWNIYRRIVSDCANIFARTLLRIPVRDCTSGYRGIDLSKLLLKEKQFAKGFAFQIYLLYSFRIRNLKMIEVPIVFTNRTRGKSKLRVSEILDFIKVVVKLALKGTPDFI